MNEENNSYLIKAGVVAVAAIFLASILSPSGVGLTKMENNDRTCYLIADSNDVIPEECDLEITKESGAEDSHMQSVVSKLAVNPRIFGIMETSKTTANDKTVAYCLTIKDNKIYVGGATYQDGSWDAYICRFDIGGGTPVFRWEATWDFLSNDEVIRGLVYDAGKVFAVGHSSKGNGRQILWRYDSSTGSLDKYKITGTDANPKVGLAIELWYDGYLYTTGSRTYDDGLSRTTINKYSTNLDWEWGYYLNLFPGGPEYGYDLDVSNGNAYITGVCHYVGHPYQLYPFMLKFDINGENVVWSKSYGMAWWSQISQSCLRDGDRVYYIGIDMGMQSSNDVLMSYVRESDGWEDGTVERCWGGYYDDDIGNDIIEYADKFYVTGTTESYGAGGFNALLLKVDPSFNEIWFETWGGSQDEETFNAFEYGGYIYTAGYTDSFGSGSRNALLLKYSTSGNLIWDHVWSKEGDSAPPNVEIIRPTGGIYIADIEFINLIFLTVIIGRITIEVSASDSESGMDRVEFYIDGTKKYTDYNPPWEWTWQEYYVFQRFRITVKAYDNAGNHASDEMFVWKFL